MAYQLEDETSNTPTFDLGIASGLDGLANLEKLIAQGNWYQSYEYEDKDYFCEEFSIIHEDDLWRDIGEEVMNDLKYYALASRKDGSFHEKEWEEGKGKNGKLVSLSDDVSSKQPSTKQVAGDATDDSTTNSKLSKKLHTTKQCMRVQVLRGLIVKKAKKCWIKKGKIYSRKGRGLCCTKNCWMGWEHVDLRRILLDWSPW